jgi:Tfp pilus assembly protein PilP
MGTAWGQAPSIVDHTRQTLSAVQQQQTAASNAALAATQGQASNSPQAAGHSAPTQGSFAPGQAKPPLGYAAQAQPSKRAQVTLIPMSVPKETGKKRLPKTNVGQALTPPAKVPGTKSVMPLANQSSAPEIKNDDHKTISMVGHRDPFLSPVVSHTSGESGCSTGKKCLTVDQIALTGIVKGDNGMIAVVVNAMNKAYFLRENDPVFNGYVIKITGDSVVFKQTVQDNLGKPVTREVTKRIATPAV